MQHRSPNQTLSSYITQHLDKIENLIALGVYQDSICQQLTLLGFTTTLGGFKKALTRARQKKKVAQAETPAHVGYIESKAITIKGKRLSPDEFALLERNGTTLTVPAQSPAQAALDTLAKVKLTGDEIVEIAALAKRISTRAAEGL